MTLFGLFSQKDRESLSHVRRNVYYELVPDNITRNEYDFFETALFRCSMSSMILRKVAGILISVGVM